MITFKAHYYDGKNSQPFPVTVLFDGQFLKLNGDGLPENLSFPLTSSVIEAPVARTRRIIRFPGGAICETDDTVMVERLERMSGRNKGFRFIHMLETHWKSIIACLVCVVIVFLSFTFYGIPYLAEKVAYSIPRGILAKTSEETEIFLDKNFFKPSNLAAKRIAEIRISFIEITREIDPVGLYRIEFRKGGPIKANALALPSGTIILTDELVNLAGSNQEIAGILAHEIAHVKNRHAIRQILQSTGVFFILSVLTGDISSVTTIAGSLPTILIHSRYSRDFEREADREAALYLIKKGFGTRPYQNILEKLAASHQEYGGTPKALSTHPETFERIQRLKRLEASMHVTH